MMILGKSVSQTLVGFAKPTTINYFYSPTNLNKSQGWFISKYPSMITRGDL